MRAFGICIVDLRVIGWSHILREADDLSINYPDAVLQVKQLHESYVQSDAAEEKPPDKRREAIEKLSGQTELGILLRS